MDKFNKKYYYNMEDNDEEDMTNQELIEFDFLVVPFGFASVSFGTGIVAFLAELAYHHRKRFRHISCPTCRKKYVDMPA